MFCSAVSSTALIDRNGLVNTFRIRDFPTVCYNNLLTICAYSSLVYGYKARVLLE